MCGRRGRRPCRRVAVAPVASATRGSGTLQVYKECSEYTAFRRASARSRPRTSRRSRPGRRSSISAEVSPTNVLIQTAPPDVRPGSVVRVTSNG